MELKESTPIFEFNMSSYNQIESGQTNYYNDLKQIMTNQNRLRKTQSNKMFFKNKNKDILAQGLDKLDKRYLSPIEFNENPPVEK